MIKYEKLFWHQGVGGVKSSINHFYRESTAAATFFNTDTPRWPEQ